MSLLKGLEQEQEIEESQINLTPLIDVVFIVLIAFIIIAPLLQVEKIQLAEAGNNSLSFSSECPLHVQIDKDHLIWIKNKKISFEQLEGVLHSQKNKKLVQLSLDEKASFGFYQKIKNVINESGFEEIELVLKPS